MQNIIQRYHLYKRLAVMLENSIFATACNFKLNIMPFKYSAIICMMQSMIQEYNLYKRLTVLFKNSFFVIKLYVA